MWKRWVRDTGSQGNGAMPAQGGGGGIKRGGCPFKYGRWGRGHAWLILAWDSPHCLNSVLGERRHWVISVPCKTQEQNKAIDTGFG
jgi:hypothetical protein